MKKKIKIIENYVEDTLFKKRKNMYYICNICVYIFIRKIKKINNKNMKIFDLYLH